jgi:hypothetical protein
VGLKGKEGDLNETGEVLTKVSYTAVAVW